MCLVACASSTGTLVILDLVQQLLDVTGKSVRASPSDYGNKTHASEYPLRPTNPNSHSSPRRVQATQGREPEHFTFRERHASQLMAQQSASCVMDESNIIVIRYLTH
jgi:hypothetical protein